MKICQQCFEEFNVDAAMFDDGFCSDSCMETHDKELTNSDEEEE